MPVWLLHKRVFTSHSWHVIWEDNSSCLCVLKKKSKLWKTSLFNFWRNCCLCPGGTVQPSSCRIEWIHDSVGQTWPWERWSLFMFWLVKSVSSEWTEASFCVVKNSRDFLRWVFLLGLLESLQCDFLVLCLCMYI